MSYSNIGKITASHGLDGKVVLKHNLDAKSAFQKIRHIFIELQRESYIPYFIEAQKKINHEEILLALDEIDSVELARTLTGKNVYLEDAVFNLLKPKAVSTGMVGFMVVDKELGPIGSIEELYETPGQVLATVIYKEKEVMIPLVDGTILSVDGAKKTITVNLPEGLLDIYL
jgi:16S rRNA processing protein RimM